MLFMKKLLIINVLYYKYLSCFSFKLIEIRFRVRSVMFWFFFSQFRLIW
jgi:hypothetical protein